MLAGEEVDDTKPITIFDPNDIWKKKTLTNFRAEKLQVQIFKKGVQCYTAPSLEEIRSYTVELIDEIKTEEGTFRHDNLTNKKCPNCGKRLLAVNGKNAKLLVCQDRECGYRETISRTTNARCPKCHKRMEMLSIWREKQDLTLLKCMQDMVI